jgi:hypothetical protein
MPIHRINRADWDVEAVKLARSGEKVTAVVTVDDDLVDVYTVNDPTIVLRRGHDDIGGAT